MSVRVYVACRQAVPGWRVSEPGWGHLHTYTLVLAILGAGHQPRGSWPPFAISVSLPRVSAEAWASPEAVLFHPTSLCTELSDVSLFLHLEDLCEPQFASL